MMGLGTSGPDEALRQGLRMIETAYDEKARQQEHELQQLRADGKDRQQQVGAESSRMISLHRSMHSSHTKTEGPAMSFFTSCWLFPQNEQNRFFSFEEPFFSAICRCFVSQVPFQGRLSMTSSTRPYSLASCADK